MVFVTTAPYRRSHFQEPRGFGTWAFEIGGQTRFTHPMKYGVAKRWALAEAKAENERRQAAGKAAILTIAVLP